MTEASDYEDEIESAWGSPSVRRNNRTRSFAIASSSDHDDEYQDEDEYQEEGGEEDDLDLPESNTFSRSRSMASRSHTPVRSSARKRKATTDPESENEVTHTPVSGRKARTPRRKNALILHEDDEEDALQTPKARPRGSRASKAASSQQPEEHMEPPREPEPDPEPQPEPEPVDEEAQKAAQAKKEEEELITRWTEEYFEIIEQLPLELHRSYALMRELEGQMQGRVASLAKNVVRYRDARFALNHSLESKAIAAAMDDREASAAAAQAGPGEPSASSSERENGTTAAATPDRSHSSSPSKPTPTPGNSAKTAPLSQARRLHLLRQISQASDEAVRAAEEKVGLAITAYEWVDRHIRRLDGDMAKVEDSLLLGLRPGTEESRGVKEALGKLTTAVAEGEEPATHEDAAKPTPKGKRKQKGKMRKAAAEQEPLPDGMSADEHEPKFCYCGDQSSGTMIGCDNEDCPRGGWFHFHCVGITEPPRGKWYCRFCAPPGWKGVGTQVPPNAKYKPKAGPKPKKK